MIAFPENWAEVRFGDINEYRSCVIDPAGFPDETFELYSVPSFPSRLPEMVKGRAIGSSKQLVAPGDVLVCKINPRINRVWVVGAAGRHRQVASSEWIVLRSRVLVPHFARYYCSSPAFRDLICADVTGVGGSLTRAQPKRVAEFQIPVPPVEAQKRIANKLDALTGRIDSCSDRFDRLAALVKRFRESVVAAGTSGALTSAFRDEQRLGTADDWSNEKLGKCIDGYRPITYGVIKLGEDIVDGTPCLRTSNVRWLRVDLDGLKRISPSLSGEYARTVLRGGEVLVNVRGTLGGVIVAQPSMVGWNVSREVAVVPVNRHVLDPKFAAIWIASNATQQWLKRVEKGNAYTGINLEDLRELPVRLPALGEQAEICRRVESLLAFADKLSERLALVSQKARALPSAVLDKAFRGELVPQDPNDEPAQSLLLRLITYRSQPVSSTRARRVAPADA